MRLKRGVAVLLVAAVCLAPKAPALADTTSARALVGKTISTAAGKGAAEAVEPAAIAAFVVGSLLVIAAGVAIWHLFLPRWDERRCLRPAEDSGLCGSLTTRWPSALRPGVSAVGRERGPGMLVTVAARDGRERSAGRDA